MTTFPGAHRLNRRLAILLILIAAPVLAQFRPLVDNGPYISDPGAGYAGADASVRRDGITQYGWNAGTVSGFRLADDFTAPAGGLQIDRVRLFVYQVGGGDFSSVYALNLRIWNGQPGVAGSTVIHEQLGAGVTITPVNGYRVNEAALTATMRPVAAIEADTNVSLPAGSYWLDLQFLGQGRAGPFVPPITISGQTETGNALQSSDAGLTWTPIQTNLVTGQGLPFVLEGFAPGTELWMGLADLPAGITGAAGALAGGRFYLFGGDPWPNRVWSYDPTANIWQQVTPDMTTPAYRACAAAIGDRVYLVGGMDLPRIDSPLRRFDPATAAWEEIATDPLPANPGGVACAGLAGRLYVFGGESEVRSFRYDPGAAPGTGWTTLADLPAPMQDAAAVVIADHIYLAGSAVGDARVVRQYDPATDTWSQLPPTTLDHAGGRVWALDTLLYVGGGSGSAEVEVYDTAQGLTGTWQSAPRFRHERALFAVATDAGGLTFAAGGGDEINDPLGTAEKLLPADCDPCGCGLVLTTAPTSLWQMLALPCEPGARPASVAAVLGNDPTANLKEGGYGVRWVLNQRDAANSVDIRMQKTAALAPGAGYWIRSVDVPVGGRLRVLDGTATPITDRSADCTTVDGCVEVPVYASGRPLGNKLIGNPLPYDVDWSQVRVRVNGTLVYTPSEAQAAGILSNQIWVWNGAAYETGSDLAPNQGSLRYFKSFWVKVLPGASGKSLRACLKTKILIFS